MKELQIFERMLERDGGHEKVRRAFNKKVLSSYSPINFIILFSFIARVSSKATNKKGLSSIAKPP